MNLRNFINIVEGTAETNTQSDVVLLENLDPDMLLEDRIDWMRKNILPKLEPLADQEGITSEELFNKVLDLDPDGKKRYSQWLFRILLNKQGLGSLNDLQKAPRVIAKFEEYKKNRLLSSDQSDINRYVSLAAVDNTLKSIDQNQDSEEEQETTRAFAQSKVIHKDANYLVVSPQTEWAAQYWGRTSDWCTAYGCPKGKHPEKTNNAFLQYFNNGDLYVIYDRKKDQSIYQLFIPESILGQMDGEDYVMTDLEDNPVDSQTENNIVQKIPILGDLIEKASQNRVTIAGESYSSSELYEIIFTYLIDGDEDDLAEYEEFIEDDTVEKLVLHDPLHLSYGEIYKFLELTEVKESPELDQIIMKNVPENAESAAAYMNHIGRNEWEEYEKLLVFSKYPDRIFNFAEAVDVGHWTKYREVLLSGDPLLAVTYATQVVKREDPEVEKIILDRDPIISRTVIEYMKGTGKKVWKEAERAVKNSSDPYGSMGYTLQMMDKFRDK